MMFRSSSASCCPLTRQPLRTSDLQPNRELEVKIQAWKEKRRKQAERIQIPSLSQIANRATAYSSDYSNFDQSQDDTNYALLPVAGFESQRAMFVRRCRAGRGTSLSRSLSSSSASLDGDDHLPSMAPKINNTAIISARGKSRRRSEWENDEIRTGCHARTDATAISLDASAAVAAAAAFASSQEQQQTKRLSQESSSDGHQRSNPLSLPPLLSVNTQEAAVLSSTSSSHSTSDRSRLHQHNEDILRLLTLACEAFPDQEYNDDGNNNINDGRTSCK